MTDRPIKFSGSMVQALLDLRKTQTRRVLKPQPTHVFADGRRRVVSMQRRTGWKDGMEVRETVSMPYAPGDRLWVREACATWDGGGSKDVVYPATESYEEWSNILHDARNFALWKIRSPSDMPRWASRLTLIVTDVRAERVQDISQADAEAEGARPAFSHPGWEGVSSRPSYRWGFHEIWHSIYGDDSVKGWYANPWVAAITFTVHPRNIDAMGDGS